MVSLVGLKKGEEPLHIVRGRYPMTLERPLRVSSTCAVDPCWPLWCI